MRAGGRTCRRRGCRCGRRGRRHAAGPDGRRRRHDRRPSRSTGWPTRRARRSCSRSSTSTAAAGCRSSSPTSDAAEVAIGDRVEMTFRRLFTADGIHNYFWKARPCATATARRGGRPMGSHGIRDRVAIVGMGCTPFGEHWDKSADDLLVDASDEAFAVGRRDQGRRRRLLARHRAVRDERHHARPAAAARDKPVTRVENYCATGSEALRRPRTRSLPVPTTSRWPSASRRSRTPVTRASTPFPIPDDGTARTLTAAAMFSMVAPAYAASTASTRTRCARSSPGSPAKNHYNGARNPRAQFRKEIIEETLCASPPVAGGLGVFDCAGVADGGGGAIVVRAEDAHRYTDKPLYIKALSFVAGNGIGPDRPGLRLHALPRVRRGRGDAYAQAGHHRPAAPAGDGRGARLLHAHRAGADGGPRLRRAGHGVERGARRHLRPRRRPAGQPRRRAEELRSSGRRLRAAHDVRGLAAAARRGPAGAPADHGDRRWR